MNTGRRERGGAVSLLLCFLLSLGVLLLGPAGTAQAQERTTGTIGGELTDASGGVLPGVSVVFTNKATQRVTTVVSDGAGVYHADLEPGNYTLRFELSGFARQEVPEVQVQVGRTFTINAALKVGNVSEAVQVTAESAPLVDMRSTTITHNVTAEQIDRTPKGRSFQSIAMTAPSVNRGDIEGGFQVNGASGAENAFTIDGVVTNSLINGASRQDTVFEYLQEIQVKTTGVPAEVGGALGGVISAVTKSGGNLFKGEAHYYLLGSSLSAGPVKRLVLSPIDDRTVTNVQDEEDPNNNNEFGGSLGGPILRDKLWFFGSVSPRFNRRTNHYKFSQGTDPGEIERKQDLMQAFGKVSYGSRRLNAYGSVLNTSNSTTGTLTAYNGIGPNFFSSSKAASETQKNRGYKANQISTSGSADIILSNAAYMTVKGGYFYDNFKDTGIPTTTSYTYQTPSSNSLLPVPANLQGPSQTQNVSRALQTFFDTTKRGYFNADYNHNFQGSGWHTLKGGVGYQKTINDVNNSYPGGYVYVFWGGTLTNPNGSTGTGAYGYAEIHDFGTVGTAGGNILSMYVQDEWQVNDRLTMNLGVRTEKEVIPSFRTDIKKTAFEFGFMDKIAPRLGVAYDVRGDGRVKAFASWGRYYDWTKYELVRGSFGGDIWHTFYRAIDDPNVVPNLNINNMPGRDLWQVPGGFRDSRVPSFDTIDPDIKPMFQDSFNGGVDYQLDALSVVGVHYVHNNLNRTIEDMGFLDAEGNEQYNIGNPGLGRSEMTPVSGLTETFPMPKPKRQYDALQVSWERRFSGSWFASANYTLSRLYGNYAGLASSDEIRTPTTTVSNSTTQQQGGEIFRQGGNVNRAWDIDEVLWDSKGNLDVLGRLATDRPHVVKLFGSYTTSWGTTIGGNFYAGSGTPLTTYLVTANRTYVYVNGRGDMGRTDMLNQTDLLVSHDFRVGGNKSVRTELNVLNVFNQKTSRHRYNFINRGGGVFRSSSGVPLSNVDLADGYDYNALISRTPDGANAFDPRYGMDDLFNTGTQGYLTVKFIF